MVCVSVLKVHENVSLYPLKKYPIIHVHSSLGWSFTMNTNLFCVFIEYLIRILYRYISLTFYMKIFTVCIYFKAVMPCLLATVIK